MKDTFYVIERITTHNGNDKKTPTHTEAIGRRCALIDTHYNGRVFLEHCPLNGEFEGTIVTSPVIETTDIDDGLILKTKNSIYYLKKTN